MTAPGLDAALAAFFAGDVVKLDALLAAEPGLLAARVDSAEGHYCGYFHRATLLHHVAGNPSIQPLPANTVDLARTILARGAAVDAVTAAGPSQPGDIGWATLGLVASSLDARLGGHQVPLLELLVAHGADVDLKSGGALIGALYYLELDAAAWLVDHGAKVDLVAASGLGRLDLMSRFVDAAGALTPDARTLADYSQKRGAVKSAADVLSLALVYAARGGHVEAIRWLALRGADPRARAPFDHGATPLHWAALEGRREAVEALLGLGADTTVRDESWKSTPRGWAAHNSHEAIAALLPPDA